MQFKVGDRVKIIDSGLIHTTYKDAAFALKAKKWGYGEDVEDNSEGIIVNFKEDDHADGKELYLVDFGKKEVLVGLNGLKLVKSGKSKKPRPINFILMFEPYHKIEEFETITEVKERVKSLTETEPSLVRDSVYVYEVKKKNKVSIETRIKLK